MNESGEIIHGTNKMQRRKSRLEFLAIIFFASKLFYGIDPEITEFNGQERKHLKWATKKRFVNLSLGRTATITERGISYLKNNDSALYDKALQLIRSNLGCAGKYGLLTVHDKSVEVVE